MTNIFVQPFVDATLNVFRTMIQLELEVGQPEKAATIPTEPFSDVSGIIGLSGDVVGTVILGFPTATAEAVVSKFTGTTMGTKDEDFADAVGELVNMVAGNAKARFDGKCVSIGLPSVEIGHHVVVLPADAVCISIPFESSCGPFSVEVGLKTTGVNAAGDELPTGSKPRDQIEEPAMRILIVDDSKTMRNIQKTILGQLGYSTLEEACNGQDALSKLGSFEPDLILLDWNMPEMDGLRFLKEYRSKGNNTPVIMVTTEAEKSQVIEAIKAGVNNYVIKPFTPEVLGDRIKDTLEKMKAA